MNTLKKQRFANRQKLAKKLHNYYVIIESEMKLERKIFCEVKITYPDVSTLIDSLNCSNSYHKFYPVKKSWCKEFKINPLEFDKK